jgi:excisionase family DNA binding protein
LAARDRVKTYDNVLQALPCPKTRLGFFRFDLRSECMWKSNWLFLLRKVERNQARRLQIATTRGMISMPTSIDIPPHCIGLTYADAAAIIKTSERFILERARDSGLRVRLLRPGLPRIAVHDFKDWIARRRKRPVWPVQTQPIGADGTRIVAKGPGTGRKMPLAAGYLTLNDAAKALSVSYDTVENLIRDDGLPVIRMARWVPRLDPLEIEAWLKARPLRLAKCPNPATRGRRPASELRKSAYVDLPGGGWAANTEAKPEAQGLNLLP